MEGRFEFRAWWYGQKRMDYIDFKKLRDYSFPLDWCKIMQSSTRKDKINQLVFEGDIIQHHHNKKGVHTVFFKDGVLGAGSEIFTTINNIPMEFYKVIGNIYQNPELLNAR